MSAIPQSSRENDSVISKRLSSHERDDMERSLIEKTGLEVKRLGFGGIPIQRVDEKQAVETVLHALRKGIDPIDTARGYATS